MDDQAPPFTENSGNNRGSLNNLTPHRFRPGQSGNPGGRPKKLPITDYVIDQLEKPIPKAMRDKLPAMFSQIYGDEATFGQLIAFRMVAQAAKGNMRATNTLLDRTEGKVNQKMALSGENSGVVEFRLTRAGGE